MMSPSRAGLFFYGLSWLTPVSPGVAHEELERELVRAESAIDTQDYSAAEELLSRLAARRPADPAIQFLLGLTYAKTERWVQADDCLTRVLEIDPGSIEARIELAAVRFERGKPDDARGLLRQALELDPENDYAHRFLATLLYLEGNRREALALWNRIGQPRVSAIRYRVPSATPSLLLDSLFPVNENESFRIERLDQIAWRQQRFHLGPPFHWRVWPDSDEDWNLELTLAPRVLSFAQDMLLTNALRLPLNRELALTLPFAAGVGERLGASIRWDNARRRVALHSRHPFLTGRNDALDLGLEWRRDEWERVGLDRYGFRSGRIWTRYETLFPRQRSLTLDLSYRNQSFRFSGTEHPIREPEHWVVAGIEWRKRGRGLPWRGEYTWWTSARGFIGFGGSRSTPFQVSSGAVATWSPLGKRSVGLELSVETSVASEGLPLDDYAFFGAGSFATHRLRAHPDHRNGRLGGAPSARSYALANVDFRLLSFGRGVLSNELSLVTDLAHLADHPFQPGARTYLDAGFQLTTRLFHRALLSTVVARDLSTGATHFWVGVSRRFGVAR